jgi:hypothetical protein
LAWAWLETTLDHDVLAREVYASISHAYPGLGLNWTYTEAMNVPLPYFREVTERFVEALEHIESKSKGRTDLEDGPASSFGGPPR